MKLWSFLRLLFSSLFILMVACKPWRHSSAYSRDILHVGNGVEPASLDPQVVEGKPEADILFALFEGLVVPDPETS